MEREVFVKKVQEIKEPMREDQLRERINSHCGPSDLPIILGELAELALELTRHQRGKMNYDDFLQELSHVQWAVWDLQSLFGVTDEELRRAVQASFR